jgi:hypothetical protein
VCIVLAFANFAGKKGTRFGGQTQYFSQSIAESLSSHAHYVCYVANRATVAKSCWPLQNLQAE